MKTYEVRLRANDPQPFIRVRAVSLLAAAKIGMAMLPKNLMDSAVIEETALDNGDAKD